MSVFLIHRVGLCALLSVCLFVSLTVSVVGQTTRRWAVINNMQSRYQQDGRTVARVNSPIIRAVECAIGSNYFFFCRRRKIVNASLLLVMDRQLCGITVRAVNSGLLTDALTL